MKKERLEAFSDGVIAIIITIMVLSFKVPKGPDINELRSIIPTFIGYSLSFTYVGIYWNNHHHMFQVVNSINGAVLWANLVLLFWLSMIPFVTEWMGNNNFARWPVVCYGAVLVICAIAYAILVKTLIRHHGENTMMADVFGNDFKGKITICIYLAAIALCFVHPWIGFAIYIIIAGFWFIPDQRVERKMLPKSTKNN